MLGGPHTARTTASAASPRWPATLRFYYGTAGAGNERRAKTDARKAFCARYAFAARRYVPDRPPVFSQRQRSPITMARSADLHMS